MKSMHKKNCLEPILRSVFIVGLLVGSQVVLVYPRPTAASNEKIIKKYNLHSYEVRRLGHAALDEHNSHSAPSEPASTLKLIAVDTALASNLNLNKKYTVSSNQVCGGPLRAGSKIALKTAIYRALRYSDNTSANVVIYALGKGNFNTATAQLHDHGYSNTQIHNYYCDSGGKSTTAHEITYAMSRIYGSQGTGYALAQRALRGAAKNDNPFGVRAQANKWGGTNEVASNSAVVSYKGSKYVVTVYINRNFQATGVASDIKNSTAALVRLGAKLSP